MLPPVSSTTLDSNPLFANLYTTLTTKLLDPIDGSTRASFRPNDALDQELRTHRAELSKTQLLQQELSVLTSRTSSISEELQEALELVTSPYYRSLPPADQALFQDEFEDIEDNLSVLGHHISTFLHKSTFELARVAYPFENPRMLNSKIDSLPAETALRVNALRKAREALAQKQLSVTAVCCDILEVYKIITARLLVLLEQKSTVGTKGLVAKTEHLSLVAESMSLKLKVLHHQALSTIYDPEALNALENYQMHLRDTSTRLVARQRVVEEGLRKYKNAGSDMKTLVERYSQIMRSIEGVVEGIKRLGGET